MRTERIRTDVLIIGGGTAGCFAAYVIGKKSGRKVLIAEKANIKRSGCLAAGVNVTVRRKLGSDFIRTVHGIGYTLGDA